MFKVLVQQALVRAIKAISSGSHCEQSLVHARIRGKTKHASVEDVGEADVGCGGKLIVNIEKLIRCPQRNHIGVNVYDSSVLRQPPEVDFGEGVTKIGTTHEVESGGVWAGDGGNGEDMVVEGLVGD